jgi:hypothetical protein
MEECVASSDIQALGAEMLRGFDRRVAGIPADLCAPFHYEARNLETELLMTYRVAALVVRKEMDLDKIASIWAEMVSLCDTSAKRLGALVVQHPNCNADIYYDRVLELRNKCQRLRMMHS